MNNTISAEAPSPQDIVPRHIKVMWSSGAMGVYFMMNTVAGFALLYMVTVLKIEPAIAGLTVFIPKIFDAFTDPIIGGWSDRLAAKGSRTAPISIVGCNSIVTVIFDGFYNTNVRQPDLLGHLYVLRFNAIFARLHIVQYSLYGDARGNDRGLS